jgi:hypothetical protein
MIVLKKYNHMRVESMPGDVNAASVRQGCVNELLTHMPEHFVAIVTGHERKNSSAMFEYFKPERTGLNPSGTYQGGDQPPPWRQRRQHSLCVLHLYILEQGGGAVRAAVDNTASRHDVPFTILPTVPRAILACRTSLSEHHEDTGARGGGTVVT